MDLQSPLPIRSPRLFSLFRRYAKRYVARHFHAVRISRSGPLPALPRQPAVIVLNHPSWWDPLVGLVLTERMPDWRIHYAPIESQGLAQYRFLERLGFFGVEAGTTGGGLKFLRRGMAVLAVPESVLWVPAQGQFVDPRERPTVLKEGIGHLAHRLTGVSIVPLALEYPFWNDRCPEVLARFGPPIDVESGRDRPAAEWTRCMATALTETQDELAEEALNRDSTRFETILGGTAGVGGVYDIWRRMRAIFSGQPFQAEHSSRASIIGSSRPGNDESPENRPES